MTLDEVITAKIEQLKLHIMLLYFKLKISVTFKIKKYMNFEVRVIIINRVRYYLIIHVAQHPL